MGGDTSESTDMTAVEQSYQQSQSDQRAVRSARTVTSGLTSGEADPAMVAVGKLNWLRG